MEKKSPLPFILAAFRDYKVGAWSPSSKYLVRRVAKAIPKDLKVVIEFGPGEGVMTREALSHLAPDGEIIVIEQNADFVKQLKAIPDPRIRVIEGTAEGVMGHHKKYLIPKADLVLSSIPFSFLKPKAREVLTTHAYKRLKVGGSCIIFHQYYPHALRVLEKVFGKTVVSYEWRNFLPCFVFVAKK